jgi:hypothetical protein
MVGLTLKNNPLGCVEKMRDDPLQARDARTRTRWRESMGWRDTSKGVYKQPGLGAGEQNKAWFPGFWVDVHVVTKIKTQ